MRTQDGGGREAAIDALAARDYETAGDEYTRAGRRVLADPREGLSPFEPDERGWVGHGLAHLLVGTVAYRVAGRDERAAHRAREGAAAARDLRAGLANPAQHACLLEFAADLETAGGLDGAEGTYEAAAGAYESAADAGAVEDPEVVATSPLFEAAREAVGQVARGRADGEIVVGWEDLHGPDPARPGAFLAARPRYKRRRFGEFLAGAVADGHLAAPRGTTEYGNDEYRCPACGSADVNWAGSGVLCLRCSTPTERR